MATLEAHSTESGLWEVKLVGTGGTVPAELAGKYTHKDIAETAIRRYQERLQSKLKEQRNGAKK